MSPIPAQRQETTLNGRWSAHCGICHSAVFNMWASNDEEPDYTACPLGPYTAQSCPNELASGRRAATLAELRSAPPTSPNTPEGNGT